MGMRELGHPSLHRTWVEIDLDAVTENVRRLRALAPGAAVMPALKADAYGHGAVRVARAVLRGGAERLGVATCLEGQELREAGFGVPVQIFGACLPEEVLAAVRYNLTVSLHELHIAHLVSLAAAEEGRRVPVQCKIDTGMGRLGILPEQAVEAAREIFELPNLHFEGVFMHFADPEDAAYSRYQLSRFAAACDALERAGVTGFARHAASSAAAVLYPEARFDMIRPGSAVYGYLSPGRLRERFALTQAMSWRSAVIQVKDYPSGSDLGYSRTFTTARPTRIAVLPVGYADGYGRAFSNRAEVLVRGRRVPVVGMVSMDYTMLDVTGMDDVHPGTVATLMGEDRGQRITPEELADRGGTIPYCLTCGIGPRVGRQYIETEGRNA